MARPQGAAGHRTEVVAVRLTPKERQTLITARKGSLTDSAYIRWVLKRAADVDPHAESTGGPVLRGSGEVGDAYYYDFEADPEDE